MHHTPRPRKFNHQAMEQSSAVSAQKLRTTRAYRSGANEASSASAPGVQAGAAATYVRERDLPALLPFWPNELRNITPESHHRLLQRLRRALREERRLGLAGSWTYDLARHARLYRALQAEVALLPKPLSSWAARPFSRAEPDRALNPVACRAPSSSPTANEPQHNSAQP